MTFSCQVWQILEVVMNSVLSVLKEKFEEQISLWFFKKDILSLQWLKLNMKVLFQTAVIPVMLFFVV